MFDNPWKVKGICIGAPMPDEIDLFKEFVEKKLAPGGCNLMIMLIRYRYQFKSHPECAADNALSEAQVKELVALCRKHNIRLIPKMNLLGHQSGNNRETGEERKDGLLRGHPELDETPDMEKVFYCRSICPNHPDAKRIVCDLMDEMIDVFESDAIHIACDEVFDIGKCPACKDTPTYKLFARWVNGLAAHVRESRGAQTYMWGDRLLNAVETNYGGWEASGNFTEPAINWLDRDIVICDWHYEDMSKRGGAFKSVDIFAKAGYKMLVSPWRYKAHAEQFIEYAKAHDRGHIEGILATTWTGSGDIARYMLRGELNEKTRMTVEALSETLNWIFEA